MQTSIFTSKLSVKCCVLSVAFPHPYFPLARYQSLEDEGRYPALRSRRRSTPISQGWGEGLHLFACKQISPPHKPKSPLTSAPRKL